MKVSQAITYLENKDKDISAALRFQVLTGFVGTGRPKVENNWVKSLSDEGILGTLGTKEITGGGVSGFISWAMSTEDLQGRLKSSYKAAIVPGADQAEKQEVYINNVLDMLKKYQADECFSDFEFEDPTKLLAQAPKVSSGNKLTA